MRRRVVFYGAGDEPWRRRSRAICRKAPAYRRDKAVVSAFTYLAPPATDDKSDLIDAGRADA